jgi:parallel beta-helix repeat protein
MTSLASAGNAQFSGEEMSKLILPTLMFVALALLPSASWGVTNAVTGTCTPGTQFPTIQAAVNAASAGSTVKVCPGSYAEQVTINKALTLNGLAIGRNAVIVPPAGGFVSNTTDVFGPAVAHVLVQNAVVTISNIGVDGGGSATPGCLAAGTWYGIVYQSAGGAIKNSAVRNGPLCAGTTGIYADTASNLHILNNSIHDCLYCIQVSKSVSTTISMNTIIGNFLPGFDGIYVQNSPGPTTISGNNVIQMQDGGIKVTNSAAVSITGNMISANPFSAGIWLLGASNNVVKSNRISNASWGIIIDDNGVPGNTIATGNTISDSNCGMEVGRTLSGTISPDTFSVTGASYCP